MRNERAWPQQCWKNCANGSNAALQRSRNKRDVGSCWLKRLTGFKLCAATRNNMQQGVQADATCNIQQCLELLVNNVASVCTGLYSYSGSFRKKGDVLMLFFENQQFNNNLRIMMRVSVMLETTKDMRGKCALYTF